MTKPSIQNLLILLAVCAGLLNISCGTKDRCSGTSRFGADEGDTLCGKASLAISPDGDPNQLINYSFGSYDYYGTGTLKLNIKNVGGLQASSISVSTLTFPFQFKEGTYPGTGGTCGKDLNADDTCSMILTFTPTRTAFATQAIDYSQVLQMNYFYPSISSSAAAAIPGNNKFSLSGTGTRCLRGTTIASGTTPVTTFTSVSSNTWSAQSFQVGSLTNINGFVMKMSRGPNSVLTSVTVSVRPDCTGVPCGAPDSVSGQLTDGRLISSTPQEVGLPLDSSYLVGPGATYWIVVRADIAGGTVDLVTDSTTNIYASGQQATSTDGGTNWTAVAADHYFRAMYCP